MRKFALLTLILLLSACGTTSSLRNIQSPNRTVNFSKYDTVIVNNFKDSTHKSYNDPNIVSEGKKFADIVASTIQSKKVFNKVVRNKNSITPALLIDGEITKYTEGNPVTRTLIGFGAGSSCFDAKVYMKDNKTKKLLADVDVNQYSWALGGPIAGSQDVKSHMNLAASKIAKEVTQAKQNNVKSAREN